MSEDNVCEEVQDVFRHVFQDDTLVLREDMTAVDIEGWDSLAHLNLIIAIEKKFGIRFATAEIARLNENGENVGSLIGIVRRKRS